MVALLCFFLRLPVSPFKSAIRLEAENAVLRHQLAALKRKVRGRVQLTNGDRLFLIQLYRWFPSILRFSVAFTTDTAESNFRYTQGTAALIALFSLLMISAGVFFGAPMPYHVLVS